MTDPTQRIIRQDAPLPEEFSHAHGLYTLYGLQQWEAMEQRYSAGYFYKWSTIRGLLRGLHNATRQTSFKHLATEQCWACGTPVSLSQTRGDHILALAHGGTDTLQNTLLLCRPCNSSKGTKDLLQWWLDKERAIPSLPRSVLCLYARALWQHHTPTRLRQVEAPPALRDFLIGRLAVLPSDEHRVALIGAAYAACAYLAWLGSEEGV
jgi:5-methylcytosine-specific restriction endonuclease McrA